MCCLGSWGVAIDLFPQLTDDQQGCSLYGWLGGRVSLSGVAGTLGKILDATKAIQHRVQVFLARMQRWQGDPLLLSQPATIHNWYPNVNQDAKNGLCVLYSRSLNKDNLGIPLAVMISLVVDVRPK